MIVGVADGVEYGLFQLRDKVWPQSASQPQMSSTETFLTHSTELSPLHKGSCETEGDITKGATTDIFFAHRAGRRSRDLKSPGLRLLISLHTLSPSNQATTAGCRLSEPHALLKLREMVAPYCDCWCS